MKRTEERYSHKKGRSRQRVTESSTRTVEDLIEHESTQFIRVEVSYADSWRNGANLAAVVFLGMTFMSAAGVLVWTSLGSALLAIGLTTGLALTLPPAMKALAHWRLDQESLLHQSTVLTAQRKKALAARIKAETAIEGALIDGEHVLVDKSARATSRLDSIAQSKRNQLTTFFGALDGGTSPSYRQWSKRMPGLTQEQWRDDLITPCVEIGYLIPPQKKGQGYRVNSDMTYSDVESALTHLGYLKSVYS